MKGMKKLVIGAVAVGMLLCSSELFATELSGNKPIHVASTQESTGYVKPKNYVRITQPSQKETIQTFDSQINIMGEASVGTKITIIVYDGERVEKLTGDMPKAVYELKPVGATETFSQLIDLNEGQNNIIVRYVYDQSNVVGELYIKIVRKPESEKDLIKSYIGPQTILDKIVTSSEQGGTTKTMPMQGAPVVSK